jgi:hypothetical protein
VRQVYSGETFPDPDIEMVHGAGADPDQNLVLSGTGIGDFFVGEDFGSTELMDADGFHGGS